MSIFGGSPDHPGQSNGFSGYGGIENVTEYLKSEYGPDFAEKDSQTVPGINSFSQAFVERNANNCTLASMTRIFKHYSDMGYGKIPGDIREIYKTVREIGIKHGYQPDKAGMFYSLFVYTPWEIDDMVNDAWKAFGYTSGSGKNHYAGKLGVIRRNIKKFCPLLLNITFGDYNGHTVSVIGYRIFSRRPPADGALSGQETATRPLPGQEAGTRPLPYKKAEDSGLPAGDTADKAFIQIYDGWSEDIRYIDWTKFGNTPASVTEIMPPLMRMNIR